jgi:molybdenum cofactor cytidylyltransferase
VIAALVLAAGTGSRFGATKQLETFGGKPLVQHAIDAARDAGIGDVVVVVGHDADRVASAVTGARIVVNERYAGGLSTSLVAGINAVGDAEGVVVLLADQPTVTAAHVGALVGAAAARAEPIVRVRHPDGRGPTLLRREVWAELRALEGDTGARALAERRPDLVWEVDVPGPAPIDVDTPEDLRRLGTGPDA